MVLLLGLAALDGADANDDCDADVVRLDVFSCTYPGHVEPSQISTSSKISKDMPYLALQQS